MKPGEQPQPLVELGDRRPGSDLDAPGRELAGCELGQTLGHLGHDPIASLDQHPTHPLQSRPGIAVDDVGGEILQLGQPLDPRITGADEHVGQMGSPVLGPLQFEGAWGDDSDVTWLRGVGELDAEDGVS